jgi:hypothetical protein
VVYVTGNDLPLAAGRIVRAEIVAAREYDLIGVAVALTDEAAIASALPIVR